MAVADDGRQVVGGGVDELYSQRSRLYRYRDSEWKDEGKGEAELLKLLTGQVRFLFRLEKTLKVVSNHFPDGIDDKYCDLTPQSEKCWVWLAQDFSDEDEGAYKQFALKFSKSELAKGFKEAFDSAKELNAKVPDFMVDGGEFAANAPVAKAEAEAPGSTPAPEAVIKPFAGMSTSQNPPPFKSLLGNTFAGPAASGLVASSGASSGGLFGGPSSTSQPGGLFSSISGSVFSSNYSNGEGILGTAATSGYPFPHPAQNGGDIFGGGAVRAALTQPAGGGDGGDDGEYVPEEEEEEVTTVEGWAPSMTLEVKEAVEMGTEQEDEIFSQRSKLYRFADGEWKERGLGDAKLLKHKETGKVRFLLRDEKTMQIVANHDVIDHDVYCRLEKNVDSDKIWVWSALDWADEEQAVEKFGLKFGNEEIAGQFKEAFENTKQEDEIFSQRSKLYRFADGEWKERGLGDAKLLKHKETGKVRFLLRDEKTMQIVANHEVIDHDVYCRLEKNVDRDKNWVWSALDWADEEQAAQKFKFGLKFGNVDVAGKFKEAFENAK